MKKKILAFGSIILIVLLSGCTSVIDKSNIQISEPEISCISEGAAEATFPVRIIGCSGSEAIGQCSNTVLYFAKLDGTKTGETRTLTAPQNRRGMETSVTINIETSSSDHTIEVCSAQINPMSQTLEGQFVCASKTVSSDIIVQKCGTLPVPPGLPEDNSQTPPELPDDNISSPPGLPDDSSNNNSSTGVPTGPPALPE